MSEQEAKDLVTDCFRVLFYRDKKAMDKLEIGKVTEQGVQIDDPFRFESEWKLKNYSTRTNEFWRPNR